MVLSKRVLDRLGAALRGRELLSDRFVDLNAVPFHRMLADRWEIIRRDVARYVQVASLTDVRDMVSIEDYVWDGASGWKKEALYVAGEVNELFAQLCPASAGIIERLARENDTAQYIGISVLAPSSEIAPHKDYNPLIFRYHMPLFCEEGKSTLTVDGERRYFREGEGLAFNFYHVHEAANASDAPRVNLMVDFLRPGLASAPWWPHWIMLFATRHVFPKVVPAMRHFVETMPQHARRQIQRMTCRLDAERWLNHSPVVLGRLAWYRATRLTRDRRALLERGAPQIEALGLSAAQAREYAELVCTGVYLDWAGARVYSMLPRTRLDNLVECCSYLITNGIEGSFLEAGVWKGGAGILMRHVARTLRADREVYLLDSFSGMEDIADQPASETGDPRDPLCAQLLSTAEAHFGQLIIQTSVAEVRQNVISLLGSDDGVTCIEGWFSPEFPWHDVPSLSLIRIDCDYYLPTRHCLEGLYDKLAPGGCIIFDEYYLDHMGEGRAVDEFRAARGIDDRIIRIDANSGYWIKGSGADGTGLRLAADVTSSDP